MNKRVKVIAGAAVAGLVAAGGAFAFWSASGAGIGTAKTAADATPIVIVQTSSVVGLTPGGAPLVLSGNFNNQNAAPVAIQGVYATISTVTPSACAASNFAIAGTATFTANVPVGNGVGSWSGQTIQLKDTGVLQDECKNVTVAMAYSTTAPFVIPSGPAYGVNGVLTVNYVGVAGATYSMWLTDNTTGVTSANPLVLGQANGVQYAASPTTGQGVQPSIVAGHSYTVTIAHANIFGDLTPPVGFPATFTAL